MRVAFLCLLISALLPLACSAQQYNSLSELYRIMASSQLRYTFVPLSVQHKQDTPEEGSTMPEGFYLSTKSTKRIANEYDDITGDTTLSALWESAQQAQHAGDTIAACRAYAALLHFCPTCAFVRTTLGTLYLHTGDTALAQECFTHALRDNPYAYTAHRHIAELYAARGTMAKAMEHITKAHLYNRTDTAILHSLMAIYKRNATPYHAWHFQPRYTITRKSNDECEIATDTSESAWMMYALCHALWQHEPSYTTPLATSMRASLPVVQKYEALYVLAETARTLYPDNSCPTASIRAVVQAVDNKDIDSFYLYEYLLVQFPQTILLLSEQEQQKLFEYIKHYHTQ